MPETEQTTLSEEHYRSLVENTTDMLYRVDDTGRMTYVSPAVYQLSGYTADELIGRPFAEFLHPDDLASVMQRFQDSPGATVKAGECRIMTKSGDIRWIRSSVQPIITDGQVCGMQGGVIDITARKQAEEVLLQERNLFMNGPVVVFKWGAGETWPVEYVSANITQLGYQAEDLLSGKIPYAKLVFPEDLDRIAAEVSEYNAAELPSFEQEYRILQADGSIRWIHNVTVVIRNTQGTIENFYGYIIDITDRKGTEDALRESEERHRIANQSSSDYAFSYHIQENGIPAIDWLSESFTRVTGYPIEELVGKPNPWSAYIHPDDLERISRLVKTLTPDTTTSYTFRLQTKWGKQRWIQSRVRPVVSETGDVVRIYGAAQDITARKQTEEALRQSEERFALAIHGTNDGLWDWDLTTNAVYYAPRFKELIGYAEDEFEHRLESFFGQAHPEDAERIHHAIEAHLTTRTPYHTEYRLRTKQDQYRWIEGRGQAIWDETGQPIRMVGAIRDITEQKEAKRLLEEKSHELAAINQQLQQAHDELEQRVAERTAELAKTNAALQESEARYRSLFANSLDAVLLSVPPEGKILEANPAACQMLGWTADELCRLTRADVVDVTDPRSVAAAQQRDQTGRYSAEFHLIRRDGSRFPAEISAANFIDKDKREKTAVIIRDITERKKTENALCEAKEAAEAANQAKSQFLANMSHELRTPMNGVLGMAELLLQTHLHDKQQRFAKAIQHSGQTLLAIINDVLDFSTLEVGAIKLTSEAFDLRQLLEEVADQFAPNAEDKGLAFVCQTPERSSTTFLGDRRRLRQMLSNLITNAMKFTDHGEIVVQAALAEKTDDAVQLRISVTDTGVGVDPQLQTSIFETFSQADNSATRKHGGVGLGLALIKQLATLMGGTVGVESRLGQGACFWFTARLEKRLPLSPASLLSPDDATLSSGSQTGSQEQTGTRPTRILLAEDNPINQEVALAMLEDFECEVEVVGNGQECLEALVQEQYDVVLMDCQMPELDGYEATREWRRREGGASYTPIIALTANAMKGDRERCLAAGMDDYLSKPFTQDQLWEVVTRWLHQDDAESTADNMTTTAA